MMSGSPKNVSNPSGSPKNPPYTATFHHHRHQQQSIMIPVPPSPSLQHFSASPSGGGGGGDDDEFPRRDERCLQWSNQETRDFIEIRGQLEGDFSSTKRTKNLWEMVANRMKERGYRRTPDQCKCKWKNLVSRYKGQETNVLGTGQQFPFFDELHTVLSANVNDMHQARLSYEAAVTRARKRPQKVTGHQSAEEEEEGDESNAEEVEKASIAQKRKVGREKRQRAAPSEKLSTESSTNTNNTDSILSSIHEMLKSFFQQQQIIDMQWRETIEKRAKERELFELEWRQSMEKLERDRLMMEQAWREREEIRRIREESLAEKRDALLTTLVNKLIREDNP